MNDLNYYLLESCPFGAFGIIWLEREGIIKIHRILLAKDDKSAEQTIQHVYNNAISTSNALILRQAKLIQGFLLGQAVHFDLNLLALEQCTPFQQRVLLAEKDIPRGYVSTYGRIAQYIGVHRGARAVGHALATNPFPVVIPCHRVIRSDNSLGGYQGGIRIKATLLEFEGIKISKDGKAISPNYYY